jgi:hypothetical protein
MDAFEEAATIMKSRPDLIEFHGGCSLQLIASAEKKLEVKFPPSYVKFLKEYGVGSFDGSEFLGIVKNEQGQLMEDGVLNVVGNTLSARKDYDLPHNLVVIYELGDGAVYCLDTSKEGDSPVVVYWSTFPKEAQTFEVEAENFANFFLEKVQNALEAMDE